MSDNKVAEVLFLFDQPFDQWDFRRYGVEILRRNGLRVNVWDLAKITRPGLSDDGQAGKRVSWEGCRTFSDRKELLAAIQRLPSSCFIMTKIYYEPDSWFLYRALSRARVRYSQMAALLVPCVKPRVADSGRWLKLFRKPRLIPGALFRRIPPSWLGVRPAALLLASGEMYRDYRPPTAVGSEVLWMHSFDYDVYLERTGNSVDTDAKLGVFLDEYLPFHPDYPYLGIPPIVTAQKYYPPLRAFFDMLEQRHGVRIVIAAHPRSHYEDMPDPFGGRPVIRGQTAELVQKAGFVVAHASTSLNFAVLFHKPTIFLTSAQLAESFEGPYIDRFAELFGKKIHDIDRGCSVDWREEMSVDEKAYSDYVRDYIKTQRSPEKPFWQIFADRLLAYGS